MKVGQFCGNRVVRASESATLGEVARLMYENHVGAVIVTSGSSERSPVSGIITDRDIVSAQLDRTADLSSLSAGEVMTRGVLALTEHDSIDTAIAHMRAKGVRRCPVVSSEGFPRGLVSVDDLLAQLSLKIVGVAGIVAQQARREA